MHSQTKQDVARGAGQPLRHVEKCAQGNTGLIRNGSVAFSVPIHLLCRPFLLSLVYLCLALLLFPADMLYFYLFFFIIFFFRVTHFDQVTDNMSWTTHSLTCKSITATVAMTSASPWKLIRGRGSAPQSAIIILLFITLSQGTI